MYGMVNQALENMVREAHGEAVWLEIKAAAGVDVEMFLSTEAYPDSLTYDLVGAACKVLNSPAEPLLGAFGRYWVLNTARKGYGDMMRAAGRNLKEFLLHLPDFHSRIALIFPHLVPPHFACSDIQEYSLHLHYRSHRAGLEPFVVGLIEGLGEMYSTPVTIEALGPATPADRQSFLVTWANPAAE